MGDDITKDVKELQSSFQHMVTTQGPAHGEPINGQQQSSTWHADADDVDAVDQMVEGDVIKVASPAKGAEIDVEGTQADRREVEARLKKLGIDEETLQMQAGLQVSSTWFGDRSCRLSVDGHMMCCTC